MEDPKDSSDPENEWFWNKDDIKAVNEKIAELSRDESTLIKSELAAYSLAITASLDALSCDIGMPRYQAMLFANLISQLLSDDHRIISLTNASLLLKAIAEEAEEIVAGDFQAKRGDMN